MDILFRIRAFYHNRPATLVLTIIVLLAVMAGLIFAPGVVLFLGSAAAVAVLVIWGLNKVFDELERN